MLSIPSDCLLDFVFAFSDVETLASVACVCAKLRDDVFRLLKRRQLFGVDRALRKAVRNNNVLAVRFSLLAGAKVCKRNNLALRTACSNGQCQIVRMLIEFGAEPCSKSLLNACSSGDSEIVRMLIEAGADVRALQDSPCVVALEFGHEDVARLLIASGADLHASKNYPIQRAFDFGHTEVVRNLLQVGANVHREK